MVQNLEPINIGERTILVPVSSQKPSRRAIIHVGHEKTGTKSIQNFLIANNQSLKREGIIFPKSLGSGNHTRLVAAMLDLGVVDNIKAHILANEKITESQLRRSIRRDFLAELSVEKNWHTLVISSELITSRLHRSTEIRRLVDLVRPHVDCVNFVLYLRRQDQLAVSRFSSAIRAGHQSFFGIFSDLSANSFRNIPLGRSVSDYDEFFDYDRLLTRLEAIEDAVITVNMYDREDSPTNSIGSFCNLIGVPNSIQSAKTKSINQAMSAEAQYVISQLNRHHSVTFPSGQRNDAYRNLQRQIERRIDGQRREVSLNEAAEFLSRFEKSNERVREKYFPDRNSLFSEIMCEYPKLINYRYFKFELANEISRFERIAWAMPAQEPFKNRLHRSVIRLLSGGRNGPS